MPRPRKKSKVRRKQSKKQLKATDDTTDVAELPETDRKIDDMPYFHGILPREEIIALLQEEGDFIVRISKKGDKIFIVLSVFWGGADRHFQIITDPSNQFKLEARTFKCVPDLIDYHYKLGHVVTKLSGAKLLTPKEKEAWEMNNDDVLRDEQLGKGNFGEVWKGRWKSPTGDMTVAIKTCHAEMNEMDKRKFMSEARIMRRYIHPNVVRLLGIAATREPMMIIMELMEGGGLDTYLQTNYGHVATNQKCKFCFDAAKGMEYLEKMKCIHRDLAARNCLLDKANIVKISDFGMSREMDVYVPAANKHIPIRWTALESLLQSVYTHKSDVWGFGILIWEVFNDGQYPYPELDNKETVKFLREGKRLSPTDDMPRDLGDLMLICWDKDPAKRPNFKQIVARIDKLKEVHGS